MQKSPMNSLISNLSKVFERIVQHQLVQHLKSQKILSNRQSGFRNGHSYETLLFKVAESWKKGIGEGKVVAVAFLDLKKAFYSMHHQNLLSILENECGVQVWNELYDSSIPT